VAEIVESVEIDAPPAAVWAAVVDWDRQSEWVLGTVVRATYRDGHGVGARTVAVTGIGRFGFADTMEITTWEPPYRCLVRHTGRLVRGTGAFEVQPLPGGGSRFVWSEWLDLPLGLLGQVGFLLVRPVFARGVAFSLRRFARSVEAATQAATPAATPAPTPAAAPAPTP
jgi:Polyketide cyclase / dehydrase and lipid transport